MTIASGRPLAGALLASVLAAAQVAAQAVDRKPAEGKPITFGDSVRAPDRLTPTPQYTALAPGLYTRQILQTASARGDYTVQVWSLLVSPHASTGEARLPGAAVLTLRTGIVELVTGDRKIRLEPGATAAVPEGAPLRFVNTDGSRPAQLRAVVVTGSR